MEGRPKGWRAKKSTSPVLDGETSIKARRRQQVIDALYEWRTRRLMSVREAAEYLEIEPCRLALTNLKKCSLEGLLALLECTDFRVELVLTPPTKEVPTESSHSEVAMGNHSAQRSV